MVSAVLPYANWLGVVATQAEQAVRQARGAAATFDTAFAMTVPPPAIAANGVQLAALIATNFFGQNAAAIAATEAQYLEMWAQDAAAMYGYAAASASAALVTLFRSPPNTAATDAGSRQAVAVAQTAASPAGNAADTVPQLASLVAAPEALQPLSSSAASTSPTSALPGWLRQWIPTPTNNWLGLTPPNCNTVIKQTPQAYFRVGVGNFAWSIGQQLTFGPGGSTAGAGGAWYPTPQFSGLGLNGPVLAAASAADLGHAGPGLSASVSQAGKVGVLSVQAAWAGPPEGAGTVVAVLSGADSPVSPNVSGVGPNPGVHGLLTGMPAGGHAKQGPGFGYRYGPRHSVVLRPQSAG